MKSALVIAVLAVAACGGKSGSARPATPVVPKDVAAGARDAVEEWRKAYEARSPEALGKLYVHGLDTVVVADGVVVQGWSAIEPMLRDKLTRAKDIHIRLKDVQVTALSEDSAFAVASISREVSEGTAAIAENGAITFVLRSEAGVWRILAEHYSYKRQA